MPGYSKRQLKEDRLKASAEEALHWTEEHRSALATGVIAGAVLLVAIFGGWAWIQHRDQQASADVGAALRTLNAPIVTPGQPVAAGTESYTSIKERAAAARKKFQAIVEKYAFTGAAKYGRYMAATTAMDAGDNAAAESELKQLANSRDKSRAALAKFALASVYRNSGKAADAERLYKELIDKPADTVPKATAELELAGMYEATQPAEAVKLYQKIQSEDPKAYAAQIAGDRLTSTKKQQ